MLTQLTIRDIVLIEQADLPFAAGLCVLSGETGAGKSILLDALGLVLGGRAEARLVRQGKEQGVVTAEFDIAGFPAIKTSLADLGLEAESDQLFIRRILTADGKSRCFINDQTVSVTALKTIGEQLVEIHGQHDQRGLLDPSSHRDLLDDFANLNAERKKVEAAFALWREKVNALEALKEAVARARAEEDYLRHAMGELDALNPKADEEETLAEKRQNMMHGEKRVEAINAALHELQGASPVAGSVHAAARILARSSSLESSRCTAAIEMLERAALEVDEAVSELERIAEESLFNPAELERIEERLFALRDLSRKHRVDVAGLAKLLEDMRGKLSLLESQTTSLASLEAEGAAAREHYLKLAEVLSAKRKTKAAILEKAIMGELDALKMAGTKIVVSMEPLPEANWQAEGIDRVTYLAATNAGSQPAPLAKIASGGELSRFMLALKVAMRDVRGAATLIFDEIDTGTGGAVADAIGKRLARLGETSQVLVVTHLPQVAAKGMHHLRVSKSDDGKQTRTQVHALSESERREELARMLAGADITEEARAAAGKLMVG